MFLSGCVLDSSKTKHVYYEIFHNASKVFKGTWTSELVCYSQNHQYFDIQVIHLMRTYKNCLSHEESDSRGIVCIKLSNCDNITS